MTSPIIVPWIVVVLGSGLLILIRYRRRKKAITLAAMLQKERELTEDHFTELIFSLVTWILGSQHSGFSVSRGRIEGIPVVEILRTDQNAGEPGLVLRVRIKLKESMLSPLITLQHRHNGVETLYKWEERARLSGDVKSILRHHARK
jgi:hypothetical protein